MKKILFLFSVCIALVNTAVAQIPGSDNGAQLVTTKDSGSYALLSAPLLIVDGVETDSKSLVLHSNSIQEITVLKERTTTVSYGIKAKDGVIIIKTKPGTEFQRATDFINPQKNVNSSITKIKLNGVTLSDLKKLLIDKTALVSTIISSDVKVDENCKTSSTDHTLVITTRFAGGKE